MAYVYLTESSGFGQVSVRRFPSRTLTPRFARRLTRGPRRVGLSGLSLFRFTTPLISKVRALVAPFRMPAPPPTVVEVVAKAEPFIAMPRRPSIFTEAIRKIAPTLVTQLPVAIPGIPTALKTLIAMPRKPAVLEPLIAMPRKPAVLEPLIALPRQPTIFKPAITTAIELAKTKISMVSPMWFWQGGIAPKLFERMRAPSGATYRATEVKVVAGADPVSKSITGAGAPLTGQSVSLKESDPIVAVAPSAQGITLVDKPAPTQMPFVTFEPIEIETLPGEVPEVKRAGIPPIVFLIMAGIALPMLFKKKRKRRR